MNFKKILWASISLGEDTEFEIIFFGEETNSKRMHKRVIEKGDDHYICLHKFILLQRERKGNQINKENLEKRKD